MAASMREEEARHKREKKGEVVNLDDDSEQEEEDSEVEVVSFSPSGGKKKKKGAGKDVSIYTLDDDEDGGGGGGGGGEKEGEGSSAAGLTIPAAPAAAASSPAAPAPSYLSAPLDDPEPPAGTPGCTRVQFRLPDGKRLQRVFPLTAPVASLYRFAHEAYVSKQEQAEQQARGDGDGFDLTTVFPAASLKGAMERGETVEGAKLANSAISVIWTG